MGRKGIYNKKFPGKIKFETNGQGFAELMKSGAVQAMCSQEATAIANRAGEGFIAEQGTGSARDYYVVRVNSAEAHYKNLKHNTLLKAVGK